MFGDIYRNKKVLVTGHTGFKGAWLAFWLTKLGAKVAGLSLYVPSEPSLFDELNLAELIEDHRADIRDVHAVKEIFESFQPEIVFHLAAQSIVRTAYEDPKETFDTNLGGSVNVLEVCRHINSICSVIMITSDKCYENVEWPYGYREDDQLGGKDPYSASKACAEIAISSYTRSYFINSAVTVVSVRAGNVIGGGDWAKDRIVPDCMRSWSQKQTLTLRSPHSTRPWQHVLEPLGGYLWLAAVSLTNKNINLTSESFNFGPLSEVNQPVEALITAMQECWEGEARYQTEVSQGQSKAEAGLLKLCCDKAQHFLGWKPTLNFQQVVEMTTQWYQAFYSGNVDMRNFTATQIDFYGSLAIEKKQVWTKQNQEIFS